MPSLASITTSSGFELRNKNDKQGSDISLRLPRMNHEGFLLRAARFRGPWKDHRLLCWADKTAGRHARLHALPVHVQLALEGKVSLIGSSTLASQAADRSRWMDLSLPALVADLFKAHIIAEPDDLIRQFAMQAAAMRGESALRRHQSPAGPLIALTLPPHASTLALASCADAAFLIIVPGIVGTALPLEMAWQSAAPCAWGEDAR